MVQEADDRAQQHVRSLEEYITIRRETSAAKPCFCLNDFGLELPEDVIHHPVIAALVRSASELIGLINVHFFDIAHVAPYAYGCIFCRTCTLTLESKRVALMATMPSRL